MVTGYGHNVSRSDKPHVSGRLHFISILGYTQMNESLHLFHVSLTCILFIREGYVVLPMVVYEFELVQPVLAIIGWDHLMKLY